MKRKNGSVLIVALWAVVFFTMIAITLGVRVRSQVHNLKRFTEAARLKSTAYSGVSYAADWMRRQSKASEESAPPAQAAAPEWKNVPLPDGEVFSIGHDEAGEFKPGFFDEQSKININTASERVLTALYAGTDEAGKDRAAELAKNTIGWRQRKEEFLEFGHKLGGSGAGFGSPEELLVVPGMSEKVWDKIKERLTVYGRGRTNMNTVTKESLTSLGIDASLAQRIVDYRVQFAKEHALSKEPERPFHDLGDLTQKIGVNAEEDKELQNLSELWSFDSETFRFRTVAALDARTRGRAALECVINKKGRILFLKEI